MKLSQASRKMKLRSGKLASLAAQPSASLPLAPSHFPTLAKGKENDEAIAHHTAAHLSSYCSSPLAGVWCRRRWWPDFALRGVAKKLLLGMHITVEWGGLDGTRSVWHGTVRSTMPLLIFYKEDDDLYPFPPRRPVRISQLAVETCTFAAHAVAPCNGFCRCSFGNVLA